MTVTNDFFGRLMISLAHALTSVRVILSFLQYKLKHVMLKFWPIGE